MPRPLRRASKWHNRPVKDPFLLQTDGLRFGSQKEFHRYLELKLMQTAGVISGLEATKSALRYSLVVNGVKICSYEADFRYRITSTGALIIEDCKGKKTREYLIKSQLMLAIHGITILET